MTLHWLVAGVLGLLTLTTTSAALAAAKLTGRVIDSDTQRPIAGAQVELANVSGGQGFHRARTDRNGGFTIDDVSADRYYGLTVSADGYADFVIGGWQIPSPQRAAELLIPLDRAGAIEVTATRSDGKTPVVNARVQVQNERGSTWWEGYRPPPAPRYTDARGVTRFEGLTAGYWTVTVEASGLRSTEARRIAVRRGETTRTPVRLYRPATVSGFVRLGSGRGIPGVTITARGPSEQVATSGEDGAFVLGELAPGRYRIEASHEGFQPAAMRDPVAVREGESREIGSLSITPLAPELSLVLEREAFAPGEGPRGRAMRGARGTPAGDANQAVTPSAVPRMALRSYRVGVIDLSLYVIPTSQILSPTGDFRRYAYSSDTTGLIAPERWQHTVAEGPEWSWREEELVLPHALPAGAYLLRAQSEGLERRTIFFVTDLSLLVKRSASQVWVSAAALRGGAPVPNASVFTIAQPVPPSPQGPDWTAALAEPRRAAGRTGADGVAVMRGTGISATLRIVAVSETHGIAVADAPIAGAAIEGGDRAFLYTDRPLYRPGHEVHWKLFARKGTPEGGYALPDATGASLTLSGPNGASLPVDAARLSPRGSADGSIELPADAPLGEWTLQARSGAASSAATFAVLEYRKPEFSVEVTPDRAVYVNGDEVRFRIVASYFFGAPVFGATVRYNLFETRLAGGGAEEMFEGDFEPEDARAGYGRVLKTGETRTDLDGRAEVSFVPERVPYDRRLTLEVEVTDPSNRQVSARGQTVMGRGLFTIAVRPMGYVMVSGQPIGVEVSARDHTGAPVVAAVTVELDQEAWNPIERRSTRSSRPLASQTVTTDSLGRGFVRFAAPVRSGRLIVRGRAEDAKGNRITDESYTWVVDRRYATFAYRYPTLEAFADRARYRPGDSARVLINTDVKNAPVVVTVEGRDLLESRVLTLEGNTGMVTVPIRAEYAPNVFVAVHVRKGMEVHTRTIELAVEAERHDLRIELRPSRPEYRPGDSASVHVRTTDGAGRPVPAEVSVAVVDEALFALRADNTPDPHQVFYGHRPNAVTTVVSFPALYYGGASKAEREDVRRDFRDVALWAPAVLTGADGEAEVGLRYPDNLTTWRITSRGATENTLVGDTLARTRVTKDVVARLAGPRFFVAGDQTKLVSVVTNRTAQALTGVEESIEASGASLEGPSRARTQIAPRGESRSTWSVRVAPLDRDAAAGEAVFTFRARAVADVDALEVRVPVRARAVPVPSSAAGVATSASTTLDVTLPEELVRAGSSVTVDLTPSVASVAATAARELLDYPYGCTEQTSNAILPAVSFVAALRKAGVQAAGWESPEKRLAPFLQRLASTQAPDGGWGWWPETDSDPYLTVLAVEAIARAVSAGVAPAGIESALDRAVFFLPRLFSDVRTLDGEAYVLAHLAPLLAVPEAKNRFSGMRERLDALALATASQPDQLGNAGLALAVRGQAALDRKEDAAKLLDQLLARGKRDAAGLHWEDDAERESAWWGEDVSNTAYALQAVLAVRPEDRAAGEIVQWLARHRSGPAWRSTRVSAPAAQALAGFVAARPAELRAQGSVRVVWNGDRVFESAVGRDEVFGGRRLRVAIPPRQLKPGSNRLVVVREGIGDLYWAWSARAMVPSPGPAARPGTPFTVAREYLRAERTTDRRGRPRYLTSPLDPAAPLRVGDMVLVRLRLTAPRDLAYLVVEDPRVAGFEIDAVLPDGAEWPYGTHAEERDDRAVFFLERLAAGETTLEYLIRPEIAGTFTALPASAAGMYEPDWLARSGEAMLTVAETR